MGRIRIPKALRAAPKVELHQHVDGSIPFSTTWRMLVRHGLNPVDSADEMRRRLELQPGEEGSLLAYLDKFHYPLWITQFYENLQAISEAIVRDALRAGVRILELRYSPLIHTYAGLTVRQAIRAVLSGFNRVRRSHPEIHCGLIVIAMRQHGPHIAKILARQAIAEAQHLHERTGVIGFDIAGPERGNPPRLFREAFEIARAGGLGITAHAGEDAGPEYIWEAIDELGATRIGHGCSAVGDKALMARLERDGLLVECCPTSNYQTGAVPADRPHPLITFLERGIPVAICTDNTTVSTTNLARESALVASWLGPGGEEQVLRIHRQAARYSFITGAEGLFS
ncbi:MAG: adenosine deaminase [Acidobacteriota bacterium]|nr:adenosine deaminase [Acidobacteriota bacterium]MDQ7088555.1 adenosine deaminase [Acidobacteriota bacterium]